MSDFMLPLKDMNFALNHIGNLTGVSGLTGYEFADPETVESILSEAGRFFAEVVAPLNHIGDQQGSVMQADASIKTPEGFRAAYDKFVESGWGGAHVPEKWGGGGLPYSVGIVLQEMFKTSNMAFSLCPMLTHAAIESLIEHGSDEQRAVYLEKLVSGKWTGTMCLTESDAGSDVGALNTKAVRQEDGSYRIIGQKIFITWGDHDLTENIIHLVLARTPGAPPGTKGISMFIVPKFLVEGDGTIGERNDVKVVSIEHKLGIHASPTCVLAFGDEGDGAIGYLVGDENAGMRYMFTMMNTARVGVGIEGLAVGERSYQQALAFAQERRQGRALGADPKESSPIIEHPDIRRMLMTMKAYNEAMRSLLYTVASQHDFERRAEDDAVSTSASETVALLTPVTKAWNTDLGIEVTSLGLQIHGGMGYIEETGSAQHFRDSRIAPIYEGTNGIQAIDLVLRKLPMRDGQVVRSHLESIGKTVTDLGGFPGIQRALAKSLECLTEATAWLGTKLGEGAYNDALAGATPYLRLFGQVTGGW
ncbi:MAG: acyl-CoA dehydrogenase, partial [Acidimicrobiia bacterium]|nr:acyl-CoA dehydrogenase [Acidimicrobiia bacterium]